MAKDSTTYESLCRDIEKKLFAPVYLFHGEESFLADEATRLIIDHSLTEEERGFNLDVVYGGETTVRDVVSHASSYPMMSERRVVVVRGAEKLSLQEKEKELLSHYLDNPSPTTILILIALSVDMRKKPFTSVKKNGLVMEFKPMHENQIIRWIGKRVREQAKNIDNDAVSLLAEYLNPSLREIQNELDKLYIFIGDRSSITSEDVAAVVGVSKDFNVFALQKAIGQQDLARSMEILQRMIEFGESPTMIIVMLTRYFLALMKISDLRAVGKSTQEQAREAGVHPFFLREYHEALSYFGDKKTQDAIRGLVIADERLKTSSSDSLEVMQLFLAELLSKQSNAVA